MGDDHLVALSDEVHDGLGGVAHQSQLLGGGIAQSVAAQSDDDTLAHSNVPLLL